MSHHMVSDAQEFSSKCYDVHRSRRTLAELSECGKYARVPDARTASGTTELVRKSCNVGKDPRCRRPGGPAASQGTYDEALRPFYVEVPGPKLVSSRSVPVTRLQA
ncbi:unnamed protein product [Heligmosomoides polygyrus]|uniref:Uncharacterized protein n=1 Tax=Heligmosomoides polygyrus TaxID=6339 RepID=A0A183FDA9_HELPZ|nr:unnamed protein product [Heligmosomoides polygyrus]